MTNIRDALGAIVDYNFGKNFAESIAKSVNERSYSEFSDPKKLKLDMLNAIVQQSGLSSVDKTLGGHPDYDHLTEELTEDSTITTLFADLRNFTRYGLFFPPQRIRHIKKAVISSFIYIVHAYDGHVHNIPGDGLMVYFGGKSKDNAESAFNAVMAGASLLYALDNYINPILQEEYGFEDRLHMRVGVEYGDVIWGQYGIHGVVEVKATGFSVDFSAKIQQIADTDKMRIGEGLQNLLNLSEGLLSDTQAYQRQLNKVQKRAKHYDLDWKEALRLYVELLSQAPQDSWEIAQPSLGNNRNYINPRTYEILQKQLPTSNQYSIKIVAKSGPGRAGPFKQIYYGNRKLPKRWWLKFTLDHNVPEPHEIEWEVVNNGYEAFTTDDVGARGHIVVESADRKTAYRSTAYSGTHYMVCRVKRFGVEVARAFHQVIVR